MTAAGFPHSDISGSSLACQLTEAYRRLLRPSSSPNAKASALCPSLLIHQVAFVRPIHKCTDSQRLPPSYTQYQRTLKACARRTRRALTSSHPNTVKVSDVLLESVPADSSYDVPVFQRQVIALVLYLVAGRYPKIPEVQLLKEVIQPQVPLRLPCYDFTPIANLTVGAPYHKGLGHDFGCGQLSWCDGRCVQDPGTYSPQHADLRLLAIPTS